MYVSYVVLQQCRIATIKEFIIHNNCIVVRAQNYGPYVTVSFAVTTQATCSSKI